MERSVGKDAELVASARAGDLGAFDRLASRHRARVYRIARQLSGDPEAAQDIAQEAFVQAFRSLRNLQEAQSFGAWLNTIVRRQAQRWVNGRHHRPAPLEAELLVGAPGVMWQAEGPPAELVERLRVALGALSRQERTTLVMHYLEGRSCEEIAAYLRLSVGSIKRLLHYSRRKARKECETMAKAEQEKAVPRRLHCWMNGDTGGGGWRLHDHLRPALAQAVCLTVNKQAKTVPQIAEEVMAHPKYVEETAQDLLENEALISPKKGYYLTSFIALEAADQRRLVALVKEPGAKLAARLATTAAQFKALYAKTPLAASGWQWEEFAWILYGGLIAVNGVSRHMPAEHLSPPWPHRPDGGRYWIGGREDAPNLPLAWGANIQCSVADTIPFNTGDYTPGGISHEVIEQGLDRARLIGSFAEGPLTEEEALRSLGGAREEWRLLLADLVGKGVVKRTNGKFRLAVPVVRRGDSDLLTAPIDEVARPLVNEIIVPALRDVDKLLDEMGYSPWREQYPVWHYWQTGQFLGEALRFLMEQGVLPRPPEPTPATFAFVVWEYGLPLFSWSWSS